MEALWLGPDTEFTENTLLALQSRWPDAQLTSIPLAGQVAEERVRDRFALAFLQMGDASAAVALESIQAVRAVSNIPILVLAEASSRPLDRVKALHLGADEVIPADSSPLEIQARALALLRRSSEVAQKQQGTPLQAGDIVISSEEHTVEVGGKPVHLTPTEFRLLVALVRRGGAIATYEMLQRAVWRENPEGSGNVLRKYAQRLRAKLGDSGESARYIITVPGVGYRLAPPMDNASRSAS